MTNKNNLSLIFFRTIAKTLDLLLVLVLWKIFPNAGLFIGIFYLLISDGLFNGSSIGKKFLRIKVMNEQTQVPSDFRSSIIRNLPIALSLLFLIIPILGWIICSLIIIFEFIIIIGSSEGKRIGDYIAGTYVIDEIEIK
ncbi:RDD family protein [Thermodesulfovibrio hydrogeniphilus]